MNRCALLCSILICVFFASAAYSLDLKRKDVRQKEAQYVHKIQKQEAKEQYKRKKFNYNPTGYMTVEEYEALSEYKEKTEVEKAPKVHDADMKYVPQPTYKLVRYNDPPGSPELSISKNFYKLRQYNGQGITSPDFKMMVYPVVYYYPNSASTASDLFVIPLDEGGTALGKVLNVNYLKRIPEPIVSTEKSIDNEFAFRSLTPVDFSADGTKILVKEKLGSSADGIWKTNAIVYDFETKTSYNLVELRDAIVYYWKENKQLDLDDCRWDIYPLGFLTDEPNRIAAYGYAYTGDKPVFLGIWSVDIKGEQSRLISFQMKDISVSENGFKAVQDGVVAPIIVKHEQKALKKAQKMDKKAEKAKKRADMKQMKQEYKAEIRAMDEVYKEEKKEFSKQLRLGGSTSMNDNPEKYKELKINDLKKFISKEEKALEKEKTKIDKIEEELNK